MHAKDFFGTFVVAGTVFIKTSLFYTINIPFLFYK